jgi:negative regulator of replication initiation
MAHDTAMLIRDLMARMVRMEAKVETAEENRTEPEKRDEEMQALEGLVENELIRDLLVRMVEVEAKVETAEENQTEPEEKGEKKQALKELVGEMEGKLGELKNKLQMERYLGKKETMKLGR